jgi:hypothetical protein
MIIDMVLLPVTIKGIAPQAFARKLISEYDESTAAPRGILL